tara:strand:- start:1 stop:600 length:600 start_codon:yes stop_codon:yes gene_type:complete
MGLSMGRFIDSFDIVCRVNQSFMCAVKYPECYGTRNDIQFFGNGSFMNNKIIEIAKMASSPKFKFLTKTKYIGIGKQRTLSGEITNYLKQHNLYTSYIHKPAQYLPSTGLSCCLEILKWKGITELYVVGFSFHTEVNFYTDNLEVEKMYRFHDEDYEKNVFKTLIEHPTVKVNAHETTIKALTIKRKCIAPNGVIYHKS